MDYSHCEFVDQYENFIIYSIIDLIKKNGGDIKESLSNKIFLKELYETYKASNIEKRIVKSMAKKILHMDYDIQKIEINFNTVKCIAGNFENVKFNKKRVHPNSYGNQGQFIYGIQPVYNSDVKEIFDFYHKNHSKNIRKLVSDYNIYIKSLDSKYKVYIEKTCGVCKVISGPIPTSSKQSNYITQYFEKQQQMDSLKDQLKNRKLTKPINKNIDENGSDNENDQIYNQNNNHVDDDLYFIIREGDESEYEEDDDDDDDYDEDDDVNDQTLTQYSSEDDDDDLYYDCNEEGDETDYDEDNNLENKLAIIKFNNEIGNYRKCSTPFKKKKF